MSARHGSPEIRATAAQIEIEAGGRCASRAESDWSGSVTSRPALSAYPLALWLAANWWRLRWEPMPTGPDPSIDWRMTHELPAAGEGFVWPPLCFDSDGSGIRISARPSVPSRHSPLRYLETFEVWIEARDFERGCSDFVNHVCARLDECGLADTTLHRIWREVVLERADPEAAHERRIEAALACDPGEAEPGLLQAALDLRRLAGTEPAAEIAHACSGSGASDRLSRVLELASLGMAGRLQLPKTLPIPSVSARPWERGYELARAFRTALSCSTDPLSDGQLGDLVGVPARAIEEGPSSGAVLSLARREGPDGVRISLRRRGRTARRFEIARLIADALQNREDPWLPATDAATGRQKLQRAFAAEFLCPIAGLARIVGDDTSEDAIEEEAGRYGVSVLTAWNHLQNSRGNAERDLATLPSA